MKAINVADDFGIIPVFSIDTVLRLTADSRMEMGEMVLCQLFNKHLKVFAEGRSLCSPDDNFDPHKGARIALGRALAHAVTLGIINKSEAALVRGVLEKAIQESVLAQELRHPIVEVLEPLEEDEYWDASL